MILRNNCAVLWNNETPNYLINRDHHPTCVCSMAFDLASLSIFVASAEQALESRLRSFEHFGKGMTLQEYLERDALTDQQENSRNGRLITWHVQPRPTQLLK